MTAHENAALIRRAYDEAVNRNEFAVVYERFAADMVNHGRDRADGHPEIEDRAIIEPWIRDRRATFPDLHAGIDALVAEGDLVATRETWSGTHVRTGEQITGTVLHFFRFDRGLVVEEWSGGWEWLAGQEIVPVGGDPSLTPP